MFIKIAAAAVCTALLGGGRREIANVCSQAFVDASGLRCFRHYPSVGSRKGWAAGDAGARAVWLSLMAMRGEMGHPLVLSSPVWGFQDVFFRRAELAMRRDLSEYVMENVTFKVACPGEQHAQTAVEAALKLHALVVRRLARAGAEIPPWHTKIPPSPPPYRCTVWRRSKASSSSPAARRCAASTRRGLC